MPPRLPDLEAGRPLTFPGEYERLILTARHRGDVEMATDAFEHMLAHGVRPTCEVLCAVVETCAALERPDVAVDAASYAVKQGHDLTLAATEVGLDSCVLVQDWRTATSLLRAMHARGRWCDRRRSLALMRMFCERDRPAFALRLLSESVRAAAADAEDRGAASPREAMDTAVNRVVGAGALIAAFDACAALGDAEGARSLYEAFAVEHSAPVVENTFAALARAYASVGAWSEALDLLGEMDRVGVAPTGPFFAAVIDACITAKVPRRGLLVLERDMPDAGAVGEQEVFAAAAHAAAAASDAQAASQVIDTASAAGVVLSADACNALVGAMHSNGAWRRVLEITANMEGKGLAPTRQTVEAHLAACARTGDASAAASWITERNASRLAEPRSLGSVLRPLPSRHVRALLTAVGNLPIGEESSHAAAEGGEADALHRRGPRWPEMEVESVEEWAAELARVRWDVEEEGALDWTLLAPEADQLLDDAARHGLRRVANRVPLPAGSDGDDWLLPGEGGTAPLDTAGPASASDAVSLLARRGNFDGVLEAVEALLEGRSRAVPHVGRALGRELLAEGSRAHRACLQWEETEARAVRAGDEMAAASAREARAQYAREACVRAEFRRREAALTLRDWSSCVADGLSMVAAQALRACVAAGRWAHAARASDLLAKADAAAGRQGASAARVTLLEEALERCGGHSRAALLGRLAAEATAVEGRVAQLPASDAATAAAVATLEGAVEAGGAHAVALEALMKASAQHGWWQTSLAAAQRLAGLGRAPPALPLAPAVGACAEAGRWTHVRSLLAEARKGARAAAAEGTPSRALVRSTVAPLYRSASVAAQRTGQWQAALRVLRDARGELGPRQVALPHETLWSNAIAAAARAGRVETALLLLSEAVVTTERTAEQLVRARARAPGHGSGPNAAPLAVIAISTDAVHTLLDAAAAAETGASPYSAFSLLQADSDPAQLLEGAASGGKSQQGAGDGSGGKGGDGLWPRALSLLRRSLTAQQTVAAVATRRGAVRVPPAAVSASASREEAVPADTAEGAAWWAKQAAEAARESGAEGAMRVVERAADEAALGVKAGEGLSHCTLVREGRFRVSAPLVAGRGKAGDTLLVPTHVGATLPAMTALLGACARSGREQDALALLRETQAHAAAVNRAVARGTRAAEAVCDALGTVAEASPRSPLADRRALGRAIRRHLFAGLGLGECTDAQAASGAAVRVFARESAHALAARAGIEAAATGLRLPVPAQAEVVRAMGLVGELGPAFAYVAAHARHASLGRGDELRREAAEVERLSAQWRREPATDAELLALVGASSEEGQLRGADAVLVRALVRACELNERPSLAAAVNEALCAQAPGTEGVGAGSEAWWRPSPEAEVAAISAGELEGSAGVPSLVGKAALPRAAGLDGGAGAHWAALAEAAPAGEGDAEGGVPDAAGEAGEATEGGHWQDDADADAATRGRDAGVERALLELADAVGAAPMSLSLQPRRVPGQLGSLAEGIVGGVTLGALTGRVEPAWSTGQGPSVPGDTTRRLHAYGTATASRTSAALRRAVLACTGRGEGAGAAPAPVPAGGVEDSLLLLRTWVRHGGVPDVATLNTVLGACARQGRWDAACGVVAVMRASGVHPDHITAHTLARAHTRAARRWGEARVAPNGSRPAYARALAWDTVRILRGEAPWALPLPGDREGEGNVSDYMPGGAVLDGRGLVSAAVREWADPRVPEAPAAGAGGADPWAATLAAAGAARDTEAAVRAVLRAPRAWARVTLGSPDAEAVAALRRADEEAWEQEWRTWGSAAPKAVWFKRWDARRPAAPLLRELPSADELEALWCGEGGEGEGQSGGEWSLSTLPRTVRVGVPSRLRSLNWGRSVPDAVFTGSLHALLSSGQDARVVAAWAETARTRRAEQAPTSLSAARARGSPLWVQAEAVDLEREAGGGAEGAHGVEEERAALRIAVDRVLAEADADPHGTVCTLAQSAHLAAVRALGCLGEHDRALGVFRALLSAQRAAPPLRGRDERVNAQAWAPVLPLTASAWTAAARACEACESADAGRELLRSMGEEGVEPSPATFDALHRLFTRAGDRDSAEAMASRAWSGRK